MIDSVSVYEGGERNYDFIPNHRLGSKNEQEILNAAKNAVKTATSSMPVISDNIDDIYFSGASIDLERTINTNDKLLARFDELTADLSEKLQSDNISNKILVALNSNELVVNIDGIGEITILSSSKILVKPEFIIKEIQVLLQDEEGISGISSYPECSVTFALNITDKLLEKFPEEEKTDEENLLKKVSKNNKNNKNKQLISEIPTFEMPRYEELTAECDINKIIEEQDVCRRDLDSVSVDIVVIQERIDKLEKIEGIFRYLKIEKELNDIYSTLEFIINEDSKAVIDEDILRLKGERCIIVEKLKLLEVDVKEIRLDSLKGFEKDLKKLKNNPEFSGAESLLNKYKEKQQIISDRIQEIDNFFK